jgi:hypothetical protein
VGGSVGRAHAAQVGPARPPWGRWCGLLLLLLLLSAGQGPCAALLQRGRLLIVAVAATVGEGWDAKLHPDPAALDRRLDGLLLPQLGVERLNVLAPQALLGWGRQVAQAGVWGLLCQLVHCPQHQL